jgi:hypothetical protein
MVLQTTFTCPPATATVTDTLATGSSSDPHRARRRGTGTADPFGALRAQLGEL